MAQTCKRSDSPGIEIDLSPLPSGPRDLKRIHCARSMTPFPWDKEISSRRFDLNPRNQTPVDLDASAPLLDQRSVCSAKLDLLIEMVDYKRNAPYTISCILGRQ
ncbi:hypothetical protein RRG08_050289 [Elysia crispata]|uniref:Uncharacterized protein n=1 Tax=Elysia crispata TaxID=231223 RepID=A0AAE1DW70_9GAST|nr:hypothetical protein RRG08_050289 [Elysia crispata]